MKLSGTRRAAVRAHRRTRLTVAARHRGVGAVGAVLCTLVSFVFSGCTDVGVQSGAHEAAASFADTPLLQSLQEAAHGADPDDRLAAVTEHLRHPGDELLVLNGDASWVVGSIRGSTIGVTAYYYWEDKSFFASRAWGMACHDYTVSDTVTVTAVECASDSPRTPGSEAVGWDFR